MQVGLVSHFTFIPMLTKNDSTGHGVKCNRDKAKAGAENKELMNFLDGCVREDRKDIEQLGSFFAKYGIKTTIYYGKEKYFSHQRRQEYFEQIGSELLSNSLVFVDPDIGLEVEKVREKHILYSEVKNLYERMDNSSILMIYQRFPRVDRHQYLHRRIEELEEKIAGDEPVCIDDNEAIFFFLTKDKFLEESLIKVVKDYTELYNR